MKHELNDFEMVDVVMQKEMPYAKYKEMIAKARKKGWIVKAFQKGVFSNGFKKEV